MFNLNKTIAIFCLAIPLVSHAMPESMQATILHQNTQMEQEKGRGNTQAINNMQDARGKHEQRVEAKKTTTMRQNGGRDNIQAILNATACKNAKIRQLAAMKGKVNMKQKGGRNNTQAVSNITFKNCK